MPNSCVAVETIAVGLLERIWHVTMASAPRGDIGRLDDETIAEMVGWYGDAADLIELLTDTGWLDISDEFRLIVHDWHEHAPGFLRKNIDRKGGFLSDQNGSASNDDPQLSQDAPRTGSGEQVCEANPPQVSQNAATPNQTKPNLTKLSIRSICRSVECKERIEEIATLTAGRLKPRTDENKRLVWAIAVTAVARDGPPFAERLMDVLRSQRPKNQFAYAATWLRNQLAMEKPEFATLMDEIEAGRQQLRDATPCAT